MQQALVPFLLLLPPQPPEIKFNPLLGHSPSLLSPCSVILQAPSAITCRGKNYIPYVNTCRENRGAGVRREEAEDVRLCL